MRLLRSSVPFILAPVAGMLVIAAALAPRGTQDAPAPTAAAASPEQPSAVTRNPDAVTHGHQLLIPASERVLAPAFSVPTASFGDGSVFSAPPTDTTATVVFFMAAWCFTCQGEARALAAIHERYAAEGVTVLTLDVDPNEGEPELATFREFTGSGAHLWAFDRGFDVARVLEVNRLDATVIIDRNGRIAYRDASPTNYGYLAAVLEALLAERPA